MRRFDAVWPLLMSAGLVTSAAAQATGLPSFNAPYRAFTRSEIGVVLTFPNGGGTAIEGAYRVSRGKFDLGFRGGIFTPGGSGNSVLLVGAEARERVVSHTEDFPLDGALIVGIGGGFVSSSSALFVPVGISLGRRIDPKGSKISIVPYAQPTALLVARSGTTLVHFTLGLGGDFRVAARASRSTATWASRTATPARGRRSARAPRLVSPTSALPPAFRAGSRVDTARA